MAWTTPITFVANTVLTAAQLNTYLRDNFMETMPARAVTPGSHFVVAGRNRIEQRTADTGYIGTQEALPADQTEYTDLATVGPTVTVQTSTQAFVMLHCNVASSSGKAGWMSYEVSGATDSVAQDNRAVMFQSTPGEAGGAVILHRDLVEGMNTFTAKYRVSTSGTGKMSQRRLAVFPL